MPLHAFLITWTLLAALAGTAPAAAATPDVPLPTRPAFQSTETILRFINDYREHPRPSLMPRAVQAMSRLGLFRQIDEAGLYLGFIGGVLGANSSRADALVAAMFPMQPHDQVAIIKGIAYSGLPEWKALLARFVERMPARKVLIERYLFGPLKPLHEMPMEEGPAALDAHWGFYFATGSKAAIRRIQRALLWAEEKDDVEKLTVAGMAKWTLAKNAVRDLELLRLMKSDAGRQPKVIAAELAEIVEAVETYETARLRKDAIARIETRKQ